MNNELIRNIILSQTNFDKLPYNENGICYYIGNMFIAHSKITLLPDNLKIGGSLFCDYNQLTTLPIGLVVGGSLYCHNNQLKELPDDLIIGCNLYCHENIITKEIKCNIDGNILMDDEQQKNYVRAIKINKLKENIHE